MDMFLNLALLVTEIKKTKPVSNLMIDKQNLRQLLSQVLLLSLLDMRIFLAMRFHYRRIFQKTVM